jgi:hypothetical protein
VEGVGAESRRLELRSRAALVVCESRLLLLRGADQSLDGGEGLLQYALLAAQCLLDLREVNKKRSPGDKEKEKGDRRRDIAKKLEAHCVGLLAASIEEVEQLCRPPPLDGARQEQRIHNDNDNRIDIGCGEFFRRLVLRARRTLALLAVT